MSAPLRTHVPPVRVRRTYDAPVYVSTGVGDTALHLGAMLLFVAVVVVAVLS